MDRDATRRSTDQEMMDAPRGRRGMDSESSGDDVFQDAVGEAQGERRAERASDATGRGSATKRG